MPTTSTDPVPNPIAERDAAVLIGILAITEGLILTDELDATITHKLAERFRWANLLKETWQREDLARAVKDLNQRMRYAPGEHAESTAAGEDIKID